MHKTGFGDREIMRYFIAKVFVGRSDEWRVCFFGFAKEIPVMTYFLFNLGGQPREGVGR